MENKEIYELLKSLDNKINALNERMDNLEKKSFNENNKKIQIDEYNQCEEIKYINKTEELKKDKKQSLPVINNDIKNETKKKVVSNDKKKFVSEGNFGIYVIGIIATILIFSAGFSLISIDIADIFKFFTLLGFGILMSVFGFVFIKKNKFFFSLVLGIGFSLVFTAFIAGNIWFDIFNLYISLGLTAIWSIIFILSYRFTKSSIISFISFLGIMIYNLLFLKKQAQTDFEIFIFILLNVPIIIIFLIQQFKIQKNINIIISIIMVLFNNLVINNHIFNFSEKYLVILYSLLILSTYLLILIKLDKINIKSLDIIVTCVSLFNILILFMELNRNYDYGYLDNILFVGISFIIFNVYHFRLNKVSKVNKYLISINLLISSMGLVNAIIKYYKLYILEFNPYYFGYEFIIGALFVTILLVIYNLSNNRYNKLILIFNILDTFLISRYIYVFEINGFTVIYALMNFLIFVYLLLKEKKHIYLMKNIILVFGFFSIYRFFELFSTLFFSGYNLINLISYFLTLIVLILILVGGYISDDKKVFKKFSIKNIGDGKLGFIFFIYYIIMLIMYVINIRLLMNANAVGYVFLLLSFTLILIVENVHAYKLFKNKVFVWFYLMIKFTIYIYSFIHYAAYIDFNNVIISVAFLLIALISIIIGFAIRIKGVRLYGLILIILTVLKIILLDLEFVDSIIRVIGLFIGGVICLVISVIYSIVSKKIDNKS